MLVRWLAVLGQTGALLIVYFGFGFNLPLVPCFVVISASVAFNIFLQIRHPFSRRVGVGQATVHAAFDLIQLSGLLYWTGGIGNPFTLLLLAPITIAATVLNLRATVFLSALGLALITVLSVFHQPLPWGVGGSFHLDPVYQAGQWIAMVLGILFFSAYAWRVSVEADRQRTALSATQQVLSREQRLAALGSLAAAAAHELGTPLSTIAVTAKELSRELPPDSPYREDVQLLRDQAARCREILSQLSQDPEEGDAVMRRMALGVLLNEVATPHRDFGVDVEICLAGHGDEPEEPHLLRRPEILYGLGNFVENAVDFARNQVVICAEWDAREIWVSICDDGPGFAPEILDRLGEPYVTSRRPKAPPDGDEDPENRAFPDEGHHGMGLGFFIAQTLLERTGARIDVVNRGGGAFPAAEGTLPGGSWRNADPCSARERAKGPWGAAVTVRWPREAVEIP